MEKEKLIKTLITLFGLATIGIFVYLWLIKWRVAQKPEEITTVGPEEYVYVDPNQRVPNQIKETKEITGYIVEIFEPVSSSEGEKIITIQTDVIDIDKLSGIDFNKETGELPMIRKEVKLHVNKNTKFVDSSLDTIKLSDLIYAKSSESIYSDQVLPIQEITLVK